MKRRGVLLLAVAAVFAVLTGCGDGPPQRNDSLTVWIANPALRNTYADTLERFQKGHPGIPVQFAEMPDPVDRSAGETEYLTYERETLPQYYQAMRMALITGGGPDVVLFEGDTFDDLYKTLAAGVFCDLEPLIEEDDSFGLDANGEPGEFSEAVLDGGFFNGKRYFLPLFYDLPGFTAPRANLERYGIELPEGITCYELMGELSKVADGEPVPIDSRRNSVSVHAELTGVVELDYVGKTVFIDEPRLRQLVDWMKKLHGLPSASFPDAAAFMERIREGRSLGCLDERIYGTAFEASEIAYFGDPVTVPLRGADGKPKARLVVGVGINNATPNRQLAYEFVKACLQYPAQTMDVIEGIPVNRFNYGLWLEEIRRQNTTLEPFEGFPGCKQLPNEFYEDFTAWTEQVSGLAVGNGLDDKLEKWFTPYFEGSRSYEACLDAMKNELQIYISE